MMSGKRELISRVTRRHFREWLVESTLREIDELFTSHGFEAIRLPDEELPSGQRRSLVECFYASADWTDPGHIVRMLHVYEDILFGFTDLANPYRAALLRYLDRDGYAIEGNQLIAKSGVSGLSAVFVASLNSQHLAEHIQRIERGLADDPAQAIGSAKELLESTLKTILDGFQITYRADDDVPKLLKAAQGALELAPADVNSAKRGADIIKRTLSNLGSVAIGLAELRNLYGTGHGKGGKYRGLSVRHARLAVSSSAALCMFLLETYEDRSTAGKSSNGK